MRAQNPKLPFGPYPLRLATDLFQLVRRNKMKKIAVILAIAAMASIVRADLILEYDIASADGEKALVKSVADNLSASELTASGVTTRRPNQGYTGMVSAKDWATALTPDLSRYFEFTVAADLGYSVDYQSISFALFRGYQNGNNYGPESWALHGSTDAFISSDIFLFSLDISATGSDEQITFLDQDISALGTQPSSVTFRLYGYDAGHTNAYGGLGNDDGTWLGGTGSNVLLSGSIVDVNPVPEPITILVLALGAAVYLLCSTPKRRITVCLT